MMVQMNYTSISTSLALVFTTLLTVVYTPLVVSSIIKRARRHAPTQRMALQWLNPSSELRVLMCVRGTQHVGGAANLMAISRGPLDPGILVHLTDMVELTDRIAATLAHNQSMDAVTVTDPTVVEMREQITSGVNAYLDEDGEGITTHRMLALSTLSNMHQDVCILAEDLSISLIVLPFHKQQEPSGRLDLGHAGFRHVNRKVCNVLNQSSNILATEYNSVGKTPVCENQLDLPCSRANKDNSFDLTDPSPRAVLGWDSSRPGPWGDGAVKRRHIPLCSSDFHRRQGRPGGTSLCR